MGDATFASTALWGWIMPDARSNPHVAAHPTGRSISPQHAPPSLKGSDCGSHGGASSTTHGSDGGYLSSGGSSCINSCTNSRSSSAVGSPRCSGEYLPWGRGAPQGGGHFGSALHRRGAAAQAQEVLAVARGGCVGGGSSWSSSGSRDPRSPLRGGLAGAAGVGSAAPPHGAAGAGSSSSSSSSTAPGAGAHALPTGRAAAGKPGSAPVSYPYLLSLMLLALLAVSGFGGGVRCAMAQGAGAGGGGVEDEVWRLGGAAGMVPLARGGAQQPGGGGGAADPSSRWVRADSSDAGGDASWFAALAATNDVEGGGVFAPPSKRTRQPGIRKRQKHRPPPAGRTTFPLSPPSPPAGATPEQGPSPRMQPPPFPAPPSPRALNPPSPAPPSPNPPASQPLPPSPRPPSPQPPSQRPPSPQPPSPPPPSPRSPSPRPPSPPPPSPQPPSPPPPSPRPPSPRPLTPLDREDLEPTGSAPGPNPSTSTPLPSTPTSAPPPRPSPRPSPVPASAGDAFPPAPPQQPTWPPLSPQLARPPEPPPADPLIYGRYDIVGQSMIVGVHLSQVPGTDKFLFMERPSGYHPDDSRSIAGFLDLPKLLTVPFAQSVQAWTHIFSPDGLFCCGHTFLDSGDIVVVGGHQANAGYPDGMKSVRTVNRSTTDLQLVKTRDMGWRRWYPTPTLLPDGRILIMGGTQGVGAGTANNPFWEMLDPATWEITPYAMRVAYLQASEQIYYPFNYVLPTGYMFTFCGRMGYILDWNSNNWFRDVNRLRGYATTQFPFTGTSVMLGLYPENNYQVEVMLFGGAKESTVRDLSTPANKNCNRLRLVWNATARNYTFDPPEGWFQEEIRGPRVMPDATLLPNGKVILMNGAARGLAGDSASGGESRANFPIFFAEEYDPFAPPTQRSKRMARTLIARMYHSVASLTTNGTILVGGCDRCFRYEVAPNTPYIPSPTSKAEYRLEIYTPPYVLMEDQKPFIVSLGSDVMDFREPFTLQYNFPRGAGNRVTRVVLVAPSSATHSFNFNQRIVGLEILEDDPITGTLTVRGPPSIFIAPPQMYMLFLLNGEVYGPAKWVTLRRPPPGHPARQPMDF